MNLHVGAGEQSLQSLESKRCLPARCLVHAMVFVELQKGIEAQCCLESQGNIWRHLKLLGALSDTEWLQCQKAACAGMSAVGVCELVLQPASIPIAKLLGRSINIFTKRMQDMDTFYISYL